MSSQNNIVPSKTQPEQQISRQFPSNVVGGKNEPQQQFPSMNATYAGWEVSDKDLVNYTDAQRRGLEFLFSVYRKAPNGVISSPLNKFVSVYQKNEEGDFVIVSVSGNNPNDIRLMEMTNEYYGDPDPDPMTLVMKTIEMADDSGTLRKTEGYGKYGVLETAEDVYSQFNEGVGKEPGAKRTASKINEHGEKAQGIAGSVGGLLGRIGSAMAGAGKGLYKDIKKTFAGRNSHTVTPQGAVAGAEQGVKGAADKKQATDPVYMANLKHQQKMEQIEASGNIKTKSSKEVMGTKFGYEKDILGTKISATKDITKMRQGIYDKDTAEQYVRSNVATGAMPANQLKERMETVKTAYGNNFDKQSKPKSSSKPTSSMGPIVGQSPVNVNYGKTANQVGSVSVGKTGTRGTYKTVAGQQKPKTGTGQRKQGGMKK